ncbi:MAG TPA: OmpA family protein [Polyangiaceae bacterium]|nr:OmpA family protein [Polyangiaceae bacterium]
MKRLTLLSAALPLAFIIACGSSAPSPQLVDARRAYDRARTSQANQYAPDRVLSAKQALDRAERAHADSPGSFEEKSLAYVAQRQSEIAESHGNIEKAQRDRVAADAAYKQRLDELRRRAESSLEQTQGSLSTARRDLETQGQQFKGELAKEREARLAAEKRAAAAMASLAEIAKVKEESRGTVITLDGSVLFVTGKSELLPIARDKLDSVAKALEEVHDDQTIVVEGHTDSQGSDQNNLTLSQARADSVRQYLISRGVKTDRIRALGKGESQPLASNDTPEGRANNRRVEIIIGPRTGGGGSTGGTAAPAGSPG